MKNIKEKYKDIFLVERGVTGQKTKRITVFFLLEKDIDITMSAFMKEHNISADNLKDNPDDIMDFYNDMIQFQNEQKTQLHYLTIFSYNDEDVIRYLHDIEEKDKKFVKWVEGSDKEWIDKIHKYFLSKDWFINSDNKPLYKI